ncbi:hypothetical protein TNCV_1084861 [Trichonephila clavipes]|nr:hypothetical protein TNCV_1084861 [Trichonephila clavipes]
MPLRNAKRLLRDKLRQKRMSTLTDLAVGKPWSRLLDGQRRAQLSALSRVKNVSESSPPATRGLLATDHVILSHGQVTWTTPELAPSSPNYHTTPTGKM